MLVVVLLLYFAFNIFLLLVLITFAWGAISAAPFVPMRKKDINRLLGLLEPSLSGSCYELGCGDGRLLVAVAEKYGVEAIGFEVAIFPYLIARWRAWRSPQRRLIKIYWRSFWPIKLSPAAAVLCFLLPAAMKRLEKKLTQELNPGALFVSYTFRLPNTKPSLINRPLPSDAPIYLYRF